MMKREAIKREAVKTKPQRDGGTGAFVALIVTGVIMFLLSVILNRDDAKRELAQLSPHAIDPYAWAGPKIQDRFTGE